jgi:hypothetical protein
MWENLDYWQNLKTNECCMCIHMTHCKWNSGSVAAYSVPYNQKEWKAVPTQIMLSEMQSDQGKVPRCTTADILTHYAEWITLTRHLHYASAPYSVQGCGYGLSDWKIAILFLADFSTVSIPDTAPTHLSNEYRDSFSETKVASAWNWPFTISWCQNTRSYTSVPPHVFVEWQLTEARK